ncbi:glycosyltransferase, partial [Aerococcus sp. UMB1112A]|uniref:glycosyltransferase family 2 protein n=1 Tax=Aerococcus sp. UMB1112A TaxID=3050609 RepID=UPI00254F04A6
MKPKISVLMCVYNEDEYFVSQAIHSITNQTFEDFEFIIINDNPNNQSMINLIKKESQLDSRIKLIFNEENKGLQQNLIDGIDFCSADYIARMDADDISFLHRFEIQYKLITEYNYDIVGLNYQTIDLEGNILNEEVEG